jgi:2-keto-4-pentenoate hydratase/2-oxohepta-3-ene-1,7-dioic acid hydratase in catechol pathway
VGRPGKIVCLGKNYRDHAAEFGSDVPEQPVLFAKAGSSVIGPYDPIVLPPEAPVVDAEVELAAVIGTRARALPRAEALACVAGYMVLNDVTDRENQRRGGQWFFGKGADTFCPMGPYLVTADAVPDPACLRLFSKTNGVVLQDASTGEMVFDLPSVLAFVSAHMTLDPGDVVSTGTPAGIGSVRTPPVLLRPGDVVEAGIDGLGVQRNPVRAGKNVGL